MAKTNKLPSPPGYGAITALDPKRHAGLGVARKSGHAWSARLSAIYVTALEIPRAALDYPVAFTREKDSGEFSPVAVLGLGQAQNLFVNSDGSWREHAYVPAYIRRHPFCTVHLQSRDGRAARNLVCVQEDQLSNASRLPLFDRNGKQTTEWTPWQQRLEAIEAARQRTRAFVRRLDALELLEPFDAVAVLKGGGVKSRLRGMYRVSEKKLAEAPGRNLRAMLRNNELRWVHAHLVSLENFGRLLDMSMPVKA